VLYTVAVTRVDTDLLCLISALSNQGIYYNLSVYSHQQ
jgi:hypothetical protein